MPETCPTVPGAHNDIAVRPGRVFVSPNRPLGPAPVRVDLHNELWPFIVSSDQDVCLSGAAQHQGIVTSSALDPGPLL